MTFSDCGGIKQKHASVYFTHGVNERWVHVAVTSQVKRICTLISHVCEDPRPLPLKL